tara:strand:- start:2305 stop:3705 length:1401 start_codon:yes stop_codon:yes gene_type:complete
MHSDSPELLLAPRPGRDVFGAFSKEIILQMEKDHIDQVINMSTHINNSEVVNNDLSFLISNCNLIILSSNSNHIVEDLKNAIYTRDKLGRKDVLLACLVGSFCQEQNSEIPYILCQKEPNLAFFSGFHRHDALRNPEDSFTANFCHPDPLTALIGARLLNKLSSHIQVSPGVHNIEGQYIKAVKNISSIFAGFVNEFHINNPGMVPTISTLLLNQCLAQASKVSIFKKDTQKSSKNLYGMKLTEIGYGLERIYADELFKDSSINSRDFTFSQLNAIVADIWGSMIKPLTGKPTRNFQVGQILASKMKSFKRCPSSLEELVTWCESNNLKRGGLEGINSLRYWPEIFKAFSLNTNECSMVNLLYLAIFAEENEKEIIYEVLTSSKELTNYCQASVRPNKLFNLINCLDIKESNLFISNLKEINNISNSDNNSKEESLDYFNIATDHSNSFYKRSIAISNYYFLNINK